MEALDKLNNILMTFPKWQVLFNLSLVHFVLYYSIIHTYTYTEEVL